MEESAARLLALLEARGETVATAESLTGGLLAAVLTGVPGASRSYVGGVVAYATSVKVEVLGVPEDVVAEHGVVSRECALAMARGAAALTGAVWGLSTTGVAGPDRQEDHPVGTVFLGLAGPAGETTLTLSLVGERAAVQEQSVAAALSALAGMLDATGPPAADRPREHDRLG